jgi:hypothetical protein
VYRRRRTVATAGSAVLVLVIIWAAGALLGSAGDSVQGAADEHAGNVPLATVSPSNPPTVGRLSAAGASSSSAPSSSVVPVPGAPVPGTPSSSGPPPPPPAPLPCADNVTQITATAGQSSYPVGAHPVFTLHITNTGPVACARDVSHQFRSLIVVPLGGTAPLWSSTDCYSLVTHEVPVLAPGQAVTYNIAWAGRTSAPGCPARRSSVPAGEYALIGKLGNLSSVPTPFTLTSR